MPIWDNVFSILGKQTEILKEMTSITTTTLKTGEKNYTVGNNFNDSNFTCDTKKIDEMLMVEKQNTASNIGIQTTLFSLQETMLKLQDTMMKNHTEMRADINEIKEDMGKLKNEIKLDISKLDEKVGSIQQALEKNEHTIKEVKK
uniref:Uncharacterized protein n=1 Tax=Micrurus carvalhoi TaxID=3147026 RepID=A0A2H6NGS5_9SAUR